MDDISFSKRRKNRGYTYLCAGSVICVSLLRAPQYSTFACCLIPVLTLVVLLVMLDDIDDISFSKRRYFLIVSWMSISVYCIPTRDTHITRDMCMGIHISRGYTYHCDTGPKGFCTVLVWKQVFEGTTGRECMNIFIVSVPNEWERKRNMPFCWRSNLSNDDNFFEARSEYGYEK